MGANDAAIMRIIAMASWTVVVTVAAAAAAAAAGHGVGVALDPDLGASNELPASLYPLARCLDGSRGRYYFRAGHGAGSTKFYLHQEGGGFCVSYADCVARSKTSYGSTLPTVPDPWEDTVNLTAWQPVFTLDAAANPLMADWNHVLLAYCDGAYFNGDLSDAINVTTTTTANGNNNHGDATADNSTTTNTTTLFFAGRHILDAVLDDLALRHGMSNATDVVLGGCSAGGIATYMHLDYVARRLTTTKAPTAAAAAATAAPPRVVGLADSGFYADVPFYTDQKQFPCVIMRGATYSARTGFLLGVLQRRTCAWFFVVTFCDKYLQASIGGLLLDRIHKNQAGLHTLHALHIDHIAVLKRIERKATTSTSAWDCDFRYRAQNMSGATLSPECIADNAAAPHKCLVAEANAK